MLLIFSKPLCQLFWPPPDQVKLKSLSHCSGQVSTQDKVRFSPPWPYCGVTAKTNMRHEKRCFNSRSTVNVVQFCVCLSPHHRGHAVWLCWTLFSHQWTLNNGNPQRPEHLLSEWARMSLSSWVSYHLMVVFQTRSTPHCHWRQDRKHCSKRVTLTHPQLQTLPLYHLGKKEQGLHLKCVKPVN